MGRVTLALKRPGAVFFWIAAAVVALDQLSKAVVRASLDPSVPRAVVGDWLYLTYVRNEGAAFGLLPGRQWLSILTAVLVIVGVLAFWRRYRPDHRFIVASLALVCGGSVGNLIDRVVIGRVTDFIDVQIIPVFNIADSGIVVGVAALVAWLLFARDEEEDEPRQSELPPGDAAGGGRGD